MKNAKSRRGAALAVAVMIFVGWAIAVELGAAETPVNAASAQDTAYLDRRISMLEQRLNSIESTVGRVEQQVLASQRSAGVSSPASSEILLLRNEVELMRARFREIDCALIHLDERTLPAGSRQNRTKAQSADPCRLNPESPIQLSTRP